MPEGSARQPKLGVITKSTQPADVVAIAKKLYPILNSFNLVSSYAPSSKGGILEFWAPGEPGTRGDYRPKDIPIDAIGVQVRDRRKARPIDILADVASHYLVKTDPKMQNFYTRFIDSITPKQQQRLQEDYKYAINNEGEQRPFEVWAQNTRLPAYFRGYTFKQWPDKFNAHVFTPEQIELFKEVQKYLGVGK